MRLLRLTLTALVVAAMPAAAQVDPAAQAKVMRFVSGIGGSSQLALPPDAEVTITFVDLDFDQTQEALVIVRSSSTCGTRGCSAWALDLSGPDARSVGDFIAHELWAMPQATNGWLDLNLNGWRMAFDGTQYQPMRTRW